MEAHDASQDHGNSGSQVGSVPAVAGSSLLQAEPSLRDLARLFLSLLASRKQWEVVAGSAFLSAVSGA